MQEDGFIFISHVEEDEEIALKIADGLEEAGYMAWYYERDSLPGKSYVEQIFEAIQQSRAIVLIISKDSLSSFQVTKEIESAYENQMKFIPILLGIAQTEFQQRQPLWRHCLGTATSVKIPLAGVESILQRIILGIKALGMEPKAKEGIKPKEEEKTDKKEEVSAEKKDIKTEKVEEKVREDKTGIEVITTPKILELPKEITDKDGVPMVLIPAGEFEMGDDDLDDAKVHTVYLDAFYIDKYEVTNAQYKKFVQAKDHREPEGYGYVNGKWQEGFKPWQDKNFNGDNQPVVCVSWEDAKAYADWAGKRLPTEAEWEKSARGGLVGRKFVWGDEFPPPKGAGNFADETFKKTFPTWTIISGYDDGYIYTSPVGSFNANGYGLYDMAGNVWEWYDDWYDDKYYANSPRENPTGPSSGLTRVLRGGSWSSRDVTLRVASRLNNDPALIHIGIGFRCGASRSD